jgi:hypothetical protein
MTKIWKCCLFEWLKSGSIATFGRPQSGSIATFGRPQSGSVATFRRISSTSIYKQNKKWREKNIKIFVLPFIPCPGGLYL